MNHLTEVELTQTLERMAEELRAGITHDDPSQVVMIGIHTGGAWIAEQLHRLLGLKTPLGTLDISFYRDDFSQAGLHPQVNPSNIPFDLEGREIILVDDVLQSGRTIRAALNEIFDYGRPTRVSLAILCDRSGRELPIQADVVGTHIELHDAEQIKLSGPVPLQLQVVSK